MINGPGYGDYSDYECNCGCHTNDHMVHCAPCCRQCPYCHKNIAHNYDNHLKECDQNLSTELEFFNQHRKEWFEHHADKIALVHRKRVYGFYDNYENALVAGYEQIGLVAFLLKEVQLKDAVVYIPTIFTSEYIPWLFMNLSTLSAMDKQKRGNDNGLEQRTSESDRTSDGSCDCCNPKEWYEE